MFDRLASPASAVFLPSLTYPDAKSAVLSYVIQFAPAGLTANESAVGTAVDGIQTAGVSAFRSIAAQLFFIPTVQLLGNTYDSLSGEGVSGFEQAEFFSRSQFFDAAMENGSYTLGAGWGRLAVPASGDAPRDAPTDRWRFWFSGFGGNGELNGNTTADGARNNFGGNGTEVGLDYRLRDDAVIGGAVGIEHAYFGVPGRNSVGYGRGVNIAAYGMARFDRGLYLSGLLSYGQYSNDERRYGVGVGLDAANPWSYNSQPLAPIPAESASGSFRTHMLGGQFELGWKQAFEHGNLTPYVNLQIDNQWMSAFSESATIAGTTEPGTFGLHYGSETALSLPVSLGMQADTSFTADDGRMSIVPAARLAWVHEFEGQRATTQSFLIAPGFDFTTEGAQAMRDALRLDAGISLNVGERLAVYGDFTGVYSHDGGSLGGMAGFKLTF